MEETRAQALEQDKATGLIEWTSPQTGVQLYEVRFGNYVRDPSIDGKVAAWRTALVGQQYPEDWERAFLSVWNVTDDFHSYVGHYESSMSVRHFILFYMRGRILSEVNL